MTVIEVIAIIWFTDKIYLVRFGLSSVKDFDAYNRMDSLNTIKTTKNLTSKSVSQLSQ